MLKISAKSEQLLSLGLKGLRDSVTRNVSELDPQAESIGQN
jgi:hypothetical protein